MKVKKLPIHDLNEKQDFLNKINSKNRLIDLISKDKYQSIQKMCMEYIDYWLEENQPEDDSKDYLVDCYNQVIKNRNSNICIKIYEMLIESPKAMQAIFGRFENVFDGMLYRRMKALSVFIQALSFNGLVMVYKDKLLKVRLIHEVDVDEWHHSGALPNLYPIFAKDNHTGYKSDRRHVLLGGNLKQHDGDLCLDHLRRVSGTCYSFNLRSFDALPEDVFDDEYLFIGSKDRFETDEEFEIRKSNHSKQVALLDMKARQVYHYGNRFFFDPVYDLRGRTYDNQEHLSFIANKRVRACIDSYNALPVSNKKCKGDKYSPFEHLLMDLGSSYGLDKSYNHEKLYKGQELVFNLIDGNGDAKNGKQLRKIIKRLSSEAKSKPQFIACMFAVSDTLRGKPVGYLVGKDCSSSGAQLISTMYRCEEGMKVTGVINNGLVPKLYHSVTEQMFGDGSSEDASLVKSVKEAVIPRFYSSQKEPRKVFGKKVNEFEKSFRATLPAVAKVGDIFLENWEEYTTRYEWMLPDGFHVVMPVIGKEKLKLTYIDEDGKERQFNYMNNVVKTLKKGDRGTRSLLANSVHSVDAFMSRELNRRCNFCYQILDMGISCLLNGDQRLHDKLYSKQQIIHSVKRMKVLNKCHKDMDFTSLRAMDYLNFYSMQFMSDKFKHDLLNLASSIIDTQSYPLLSIHDDFRCHSNYIEDMTRKFNTLLAELYSSKMGSYLMAEVIGYDYKLPRKKPHIAKKILCNEYAIS